MTGNDDSPPRKEPVPPGASENDARYPAVGQGIDQRNLRAILSSFAPSERLGRETLQHAKVSEYGEQSREVLESARSQLRKNPESLDIKDWLAFLLYQKKEYAEARELYSDIVQRTQGTCSQRYYLANCHLAMGQTTQAVELWESVIREEPDSKYARKALARIKYLHHILRANQGSVAP